MPIRVDSLESMASETSKRRLSTIDDEVRGDSVNPDRLTDFGRKIEEMHLETFEVDRCAGVGSKGILEAERLKLRLLKPASNRNGVLSDIILLRGAA